jgi:hypothetical protein
MLCSASILAKDDPNVINNGVVALDFTPEVDVPDINFLGVGSILVQTDTHYILRMTNTLVKSMVKPMSIYSFVVRAQNCL